MTALDIQPHSQRITHRVVLGLSALAAAAFLGGVVRQLTPDPSLFPVSSPVDRDYGGPPEATPAPALQVAPVQPVARPPSPAAAEVDDAAVPAPEVHAEAAEPVVDVTAAIPDQSSTPAPATAPSAQATAPSTPAAEPDAAPPT